MDLRPLILPKPQTPWEKDLIMALYEYLSQLTSIFAGDGTVVMGDVGVTLIISNTEPVGVIQSGTIWIKPSDKTEWHYLVDRWVPVAGA